MSPFLSEEDQRAIEAGLRSVGEVAERAVNEIVFNASEIEQHTLKCFAHLLALGRLELKIAVMKSGLFHPKIWLFETPLGHAAAHGSSNLTRSGIRSNFEQITISKAWADPNQAYIVNKLRDQFSRLWSGDEEDCKVVDLPKALSDKLLRTYGAAQQPTEEDLQGLYAKASTSSVLAESGPATEPDLEPGFSVPAWLNYRDGPYAHQGRAIDAWVQADFRGTLEMATGSGKTLTAMVATHKLYEREQPILVVVAAPYIPLIDQWCGEIALFGLKPNNLTTMNAAERKTAITQVRRRLRLGLTSIEVLVVSHDTLCSDAFKDALRDSECRRLLIADEAHNLGRENFVSDPPEFFEFRMALSATPVRQYDPDGTDAIFAFFGPVVFRFTLAEAIGTCLVEYEYFVHPVDLHHIELDRWHELTDKIRQNSWRVAEGASDEYLMKLYRDRRLVLENAVGKIAALEQLLDRENLGDLKHTLVYTTDKAPEQLDGVNALLARKSLLFHQLTAHETANRQDTARIIAGFQSGELQVLTAKRVLDEGVNIPQICRAFILASTTVERQWIQRRGRLLRTCTAIGKEFSIIHDFIALPPRLDNLDDDAKQLVKGELHRAREFATLARNAGRQDGPLELIHKLVQSVFM
jgi:superfamily II DNA or RNA helicase